MLHIPPSSRARWGFTLVELLAVMAIIAILVALTTAGVLQILKRGPQVVTANEIGQLSMVLQGFKGKYGVYPPSKITLASTQAAINAADPSGASMNFLNKMWPRLATTGLDWSGTGADGPWTLEGDQCLVFFLGGIPGASAPTGFSTNGSNPTQAGGDRVKFFDFPSNRMNKRSGSLFFSYRDPWSSPNDPKPYAYFSSGFRPGGYSASDCVSLIADGPYYDTPTATTPRHFLNNDSFQIICAGQNNLFGSGGLWNPANPGAIGDNTRPDKGGGMDDQTNFATGILGALQN